MDELAELLDSSPDIQELNLSDQEIEDITPYLEYLSQFTQLK